jgi:hypothetical protein
MVKNKTQFFACLGIFFFEVSLLVLCPYSSYTVQLGEGSGKGRNCAAEIGAIEALKAIHYSRLIIP